MEALTKEPNAIDNETAECQCDPCECDPCTCCSSTTNAKTKIIGAALALGGLAAAAGAYFKVIRPWHLKWGATDQEAKSVMPGDELIPGARSITHAITIEAPVGIVWPLLAELGENKGGIYRLTWLENVIESDEAPEGVEPTWQDLAVGDTILLHNNYPPAPVLSIEPKKNLVLGLDLNTEKAATWSFVLSGFSLSNDPTTEHTRLIIRFREPEKLGMEKAVDLLATEPVQFVLERKMLLTLKKLAEDAVQSEQH